ncbi:hypothetical protein F4777DRAFT_547855 [Nemania sp. FL0916]|nr:hypothetical protein F4777DRAFT_547855 [Nemania sp. FL0916]
MRYHECCPYLRTRNWQALYQSNITTLHALKSSAKSSCTFIAIDFEGLCAERGEPLALTDIGVAVLPFPRPTLTQPESTQTSNTSPVRSQRLQTFFDQNSIECHWLRLKGQRSISGPKEICHFGQFQEIEPAQTEATLVTLLQSIQQRHNAPMVLTGFDLVFELKTIESHLSQVLRFFSSWVDIQDIIMKVAGLKNTPGLRDAVRSVGFSDSIATSGGNKSHNPADDTVRELAVLIKLLELQEGSTLQVEIGRRREQHEQQMYWYGRAPSPKELYPFTARVYIQGKRLSSVLPHFRQLAEMFEMYDPTAVGIAAEGRYGWVSLSTLEGLTRFIQDVHGKELRGETWIVASKYDPSIIPMTKIELLNAKQAAQVAEQGRKQLERYSRRKHALKIEQDTLDLQNYL